MTEVEYRAVINGRETEPTPYMAQAEEWVQYARAAGLTAHLESHVIWNGEWQRA